MTADVFEIGLEHGSNSKANIRVVSQKLELYDYEYQGFDAKHSRIQYYIAFSFEYFYHNLHDIICHNFDINDSIHIRPHNHDHSITIMVISTTFQTTPITSTITM